MISLVLASTAAWPSTLSALVPHQAHEEGVLAMGAGAAHVFAIDRLATPQLAILHLDYATGRVELIEGLVVGRHLLLQGREIDVRQQASPGGSTRIRGQAGWSVPHNSAASAWAQLTIAKMLV